MHLYEVTSPMIHRELGICGIGGERPFPMFESQPLTFDQMRETKELPPLHRAIYEGKEDLVEQLLIGGADPNELYTTSVHLDKMGFDFFGGQKAWYEGAIYCSFPLGIATDQVNLKIMKLLVDYGANPYRNVFTIYHAVLKRNVTIEYYPMLRAKRASPPEKIFTIAKFLLEYLTNEQLLAPMDVTYIQSAFFDGSLCPCLADYLFWVGNDHGDGHYGWNSSSPGVWEMLSERGLTPPRRLIPSPPPPYDDQLY